MLHSRPILLCALALLLQPPTPAQPPQAPKPAAPAQPAATKPADNRQQRLPEGAKILRDIEFARPPGEGGAPGQPLMLDLFVPDKDAAAPLPLIVWIHGGGWQMGSKELCPAASFVKSGFVVATINYRLTDVACWPAQINDCKAAVRFLRAHAAEYHIDPTRVGVWGASAGGHLAALMGTSGGVAEIEGPELGCADQSSTVQAVCDWFGPTDFTVMQQDTRGHNMVDKLLCGPVLEHLDNAKSASPMTFITPDDPPFLIMQGGKDNLVPKAQSETFAAALKSAGVSTDLRILENAGHGVGFGASDIKTVQEFFIEKLRARTNDAHAAGSPPPTAPAHNEPGTK